MSKDRVEEIRKRVGRVWTSVSTDGSADHSNAFMKWEDWEAVLSAIDTLKQENEAFRAAAVPFVEKKDHVAGTDGNKLWNFCFTTKEFLDLAELVGKEEG